MRWIPLFALPLFTLAVVDAAPVPKHPQDEPLWPTAVGTRWVYAAGRAEVTVEVTKVEESKGAKVVTSRRVEDGKPGEVWQIVHISGDGVFVSDDGGIKCDPPTCLIRTPTPAGEKWKADFAFGNSRYTGERSAGKVEEIEVPAGRFSAIPVLSDLKLTGAGNDRYTVWYAPGVGEVKMETSSGGKRELKSFTPGKR